MENSMNINEARARIKARSWQALAQSDVDLKTYDQNALDSLIGIVTDAALLELDEEIANSIVQTAGRDVVEEDGEKVLWEGRPFLSLNTRYVITNERVRIFEGMLAKDREDIELVRVQDIDQSQSISERLLNIGDIHLRSHDRSHPETVLRNVKGPQEVHEILRRAVLDARKRHKLTYREEM